MRGYLISLNIKDLLHTPANAASVLAQGCPGLLGSQNPVDQWLKKNFELTVKGADLSVKPKETVYFLDADLSI